jgi:PAP2 superfamily protein
VQHDSAEQTSHPVGAAVPIWCFIAAAALAATAASIAAGISFRPQQLGYVVLVVIGALGLSAFYTVLRPDERVARLFRAAIELFLLSFLCGSLSYAATSLNRPLWDEVFVAWDQALGFDWRYWLGVLNEHPKTNLVLAFAYHSMWPQLAIVIVALVTVRDYRRLDVFLLAFGFAAAITVVIAGFMPALSPLAHFAITPADHPNIVLAVPREFEAQALALRDGSMRVIELGEAQGLVTFPSFHTVVAVLLLIGFRHVPYVRWLSLVLNVLMLMSIPIEGSHYLVDLIAGVGVALLAWSMARATADSAAPALRKRLTARFPSGATGT